MRDTFASLLLQEGALITYVSQQLGHRDAAITLRVYAHWLPAASTYTLVNRLDDAASNVTQPSPATSRKEVQRALSGFGISGEPGGNRTHNPQIKSLLLCQLSYRPDVKRDDRRAAGAPRQNPILAQRSWRPSTRARFGSKPDTTKIG